VLLTPAILDKAVLSVAAHLPHRVRRPIDWRDTDESHLWRELVASILGSAVPYEQAYRALSTLDDAGFTRIPSDLSTHRLGVEGCLRTVGYRFPASRSSHICATSERLYGAGTTLHSFLLACEDPMAARRRLVSACLGIGPKQASLFLRNIGYQDFAVLDRHLLAYLKFVGAIERDATAASSIGEYERVEQLAHKNADRLSLTQIEFDLAVWVTMRTIREVGN